MLSRILEDIINDYNNKYTVLIDGQEDSTVKDIEGLKEYYDFKEIYYNPSHPEYKKAKVLAKKKNRYDFDHIYHILKMRNYGK